MMIFFSGVPFGDPCSDDGECTDPNNVCTSSVCACSDGSFLEDSSTTCTASKNWLLVYGVG